MFFYKENQALTDIVPVFSFLVLPMANKTTSESYDNEQKRTIGAISWFGDLIWYFLSDS
jgi:hypothetical protein